MAITEYLDKMKNLVDAMAAIDQPISEKELIVVILNGIGQGHAPILTSVDNRESQNMLNELFGQLLTLEIRFEGYSQSQAIEQPSTAFLTQKKAIFFSTWMWWSQVCSLQRPR